MFRRMNRRTAIGAIGLPFLLSLFGPNLGTSIAKESEKTQKPLVIFFQAGGHSPYESFSPLVDSIKEYRGPFGSVQTKHGIRISDRFPRFSQIAHRATIIRSLDAENASHEVRPITGGQFADYGKRGAKGNIPYSVVEIDGQFDVYRDLQMHRSFPIEWDPINDVYAPPQLMKGADLRGRKTLLRTLEKKIDETRLTRHYTENQELAFRLMINDGYFRQIFKITEEQNKRNGKGGIGQAASIGENLAMSGIGMTLIYNEAYTSMGSGWDMHDDIEIYTRELSPPTDHALTGLAERALRGEIVLACFSEHGRTPWINKDAGRDHYPVGYFVGVGGDFREGEVYGGINLKGDIAYDRVAAGEIVPTMLRACRAPLKPEERYVKRVIV